MAVRYIYNTSGNYVAFVLNGNLFSPSSEWLGFIRNGNQVYLKNGKFVGYLLNDDRIARRKDELQRMNLLAPLSPLKPLMPLRPMKRLPMAQLLHPFEDVFEAGLIAPRTLIYQGAIRTFDKILGAHIFAHDATDLGMISKDKYSTESISNPYGTAGNKYNPQSILNSYGTYGSPYSQLSPFNQYSQTPPKIIKGDNILGFLTKNKFMIGTIDPDELLVWLGLK